MDADRALLSPALLLGFLLAPGLAAQEKPKDGAVAATKPAAAAPQEPDEATLRASREKKLASEFLKKAAWVLDYDAARAEAKRTGKILFAYFTRSYAP